MVEVEVVIVVATAAAAIAGGRLPPGDDWEMYEGKMNYGSGEAVDLTICG
jgi:hypothetical protein